jgi:hypothetical protein
MATVQLNLAAWAESQFGTCVLGDQRRNRRVVKLAAQVAAQPDASTPKQTERWADCKAAYRLFDRPEVTFEALIAPHCAQTRAVGAGTWLIINDTTELNYGANREVEGLGRLGGEGWGRGFFLHTAMMIGANTEEVVGLAAQELFVRPLRKLRRTTTARRKLRRRESEVWGRVIDCVGPPAEEVKFVHVCDRGADNFEVYCRLQANRSGWVIRAAQLHRVVLDSRGQRRTLDEILSEQPCVGIYELKVQANKKQPARTARIEVRIAQVVLPRPQHLSKYLRRNEVQEIPMYAVEAREVDPPACVQPLRWVLLTSEEVRTFDDAWRVITWYEKRPMIEEYHKCLKTGCRVEARQYERADRLAAVIGLLSVVAVRLLQLKLVARKEPERPAAEVVPKSWLETLRAVTKTRKPINTVREFFRGLAMFGGFLGRKGDGEPGWQTIWAGLDKLLLCVRGAETMAKKCG